MEAIIPLLTVGTTLGGTGVQVAGELGAAKAGKEAAFREAGFTLAQGERRASLAIREGERLAASQKAAFSASGFLATEGSALEVLLETERETREEAENILKTAQFQAQELVRGGQAQLTGGILSAIGIGLGGAGQAASQAAERGFFKGGGVSEEARDALTFGFDRRARGRAGL